MVEEPRTDPNWSHPYLQNGVPKNELLVVKIGDEWYAINKSGQVLYSHEVRDKVALYGNYLGYSVSFEDINDYDYAEAKSWKDWPDAPDAVGPPRVLSPIQKKFKPNTDIRVPSSEGGGYWIVTLNKNGNGSCACNCPAFKFGKTNQYGYCKHIVNTLSSNGIVTGYVHSLNLTYGIFKEFW